MFYIKRLIYIDYTGMDIVQKYNIRYVKISEE